MAICVCFVIPQAAEAQTSVLTQKGVNLAGLEFDGCANSGIEGTDYFVTPTSEIDYYIGKGMNVFRVPFCWDRLQPPAADGTPSAAFDSDYLQTLFDLVSYATSQNAKVILDPHNYARYGTNNTQDANAIITRDADAGPGDTTISDFAAFWSLLADEFQTNSDVIFGLMNEPNTMSSEVWRDAAQAAINAIRATGATNQILVPGNAWSGAHSWNQNWYGTSNSVTMLTLTDSANNLAFEVHQYFDINYIGTYTDPLGADPNDDGVTLVGCITTDGAKGSQQLVDFTNWLRANNRVGFMGEFGVPPTPECLEDLEAMLQYMEDNDDVWQGWTYWAGGPQWDTYRLRITPGPGNSDRPQMAVLEPFLQDPTYVSLATFDAVPINNGVQLIWTTAVEIDNAGFNLYRSNSASGPWTQVNQQLIPGRGDTAETTEYSFVDPSNATFYMLEDVDTSGKATQHAPMEVSRQNKTFANNDRALFLPLMY